LPKTIGAVSAKTRKPRKPAKAARKTRVRVLWNHSVDAQGSPLALVFYSDRTWEYIAHDEF